MNAAEIEAKIKYRVEDQGEGLWKVTARLDHEQVTLVSSSALGHAHRDVVLDQVKADLKERFLRDLYADQRRSLSEALFKLAELPLGQGHYGVWRAGVLALLDLARRQPPSGVLPEGPDI